MALNFTSEDAAREGERKEPPPAPQAQMAEIESLSIGETAFFDLKQPWLDSPRWSWPAHSVGDDISRLWSSRLQEWQAADA